MPGTRSEHVHAAGHVSTGESKKRNRPTQTPRSSKRQRRDTPEQAPTDDSLEALDEEDGDGASDDGQTTRTDQNLRGQTKGHIRFGSEEPPAIPIEQEDEALEESAPDESDSDDAPEDVTASAAEAGSKAAAQKTSRLLEKRRADERKRRQEREGRLKDQAQSSSRRQKANAKKEATKEDAEPELLPDDILADLPAERSPTPDLETLPQTANTKAAPKNRLIKFEESEPRARTVGPVRVNVLRKMQPNMAPKAGKGSKSVKEAWLAGQRGRNSQPGRQPFRGGFLRKS